MGHKFEVKLTILMDMGEDPTREFLYEKSVELSPGVPIPKEIHNYVRGFMKNVDGIATETYNLYEIVEEEELPPEDQDALLSEEEESVTIEVLSEETEEVVEVEEWSEEIADAPKVDTVDVQPLYTVEAVLQKAKLETRKSQGELHSKTGN